MPWGYPILEVLWDGDWVPLERTWVQWKYYGMEMGYSSLCEQTETCENSTSVVLRTRAVILMNTVASKDFQIVKERVSEAWLTLLSLVFVTH